LTDEGWLRREALPIVQQVARSLARGPWTADYDDMVQEGLLAVWREGVTDRGLVSVCARRRMIDAQRRSYGRAGTTSHAAYQGQRSLDYPVGMANDTPLSALLGAEDRGYAEVEAREMLPHLDDEQIGLRPREREVLRRQARGELLREIGVEWNVTEARVCQISIRARRKIKAAMDDRA